MKRAFAFVVPAVLLMLGLVPAGAASAGVQTSEDIVFDTYCDGLHLNFPSIGLPATEYSVDGYQTGCVTGGVFGLAKPDMSGNYGVTEGREFLTIPGFGTHTVINRDFTWTHYGLSGNLIYVLNKGTWSFGMPKGGAGVASSTPTAPQRGANVQTIRNLVFDGYCDGMEINSPSLGLGQLGTVDGHRTGCSADALMGSMTLIDHLGGSFVVSFFADGYQWLETAIYQDNTWVHYAISGNEMYILNSGTWHHGIPQGGPGTSSTG